MKIWKMNDCDWVMAHTAEEAKEVLATITDVFEEDEVRELTDDELDHFKFCEENDDGEILPVRTFRQELERRIAAGEGPDMFASSEY